LERFCHGENKKQKPADEQHGGGDGDDEREREKEAGLVGRHKGKALGLRGVDWQGLAGPNESLHTSGGFKEKRGLCGRHYGGDDLRVPRVAGDRDPAIDKAQDDRALFSR